jgi:16S rRNA (uracil1498-N3)-methyltransferase
MAADRWALVIGGALEAGSRVELDQVESRHLAATLRLRPGDLVTLCDGRGAIAEASLAVVDARRCELEVIALLPAAGPPDPMVTVALSVLHSQAMDWAVQKCVEVGVATLIPLLSERSQLSAKASSGRLGHWRRVGWQALKQCRRPWQMEIVDPTSLEQLVADRAGRPGLVADPEGEALSDQSGVLPELLAIGPEGGFSVRELALLRGAGWGSVSLGRWVLRAETAAVVGAAMLIAALPRSEPRV